MKDPYSFEFLALAEDMLERDLERGLLDQLKSLILSVCRQCANVSTWRSAAAAST